MLTVTKKADSHIMLSVQYIREEVATGKHDDIHGTILCPYISKCSNNCLQTSGGGTHSEKSGTSTIFAFVVSILAGNRFLQLEGCQIA